MLTVYKASAGAGKTFRLAVEYIKHLIISPLRYESILAVTFTNKATEEMKMRILSQLYGIAHGLPSSDAYLKVMLPELVKMQSAKPFTDEAVTETFVRRRAGIALNRLLHNYTFFRVETIDRFFQTVLRNLARELDLTPNLRVELADKEIEHEAVDRWIDSLKENDTQLSWITDYIRSNMDDGKAWNIIGEIKKFGEQLLSDEYKRYSEKLDKTIDEIKFDDFIRTLRQIVSDAEKKFREHAVKLNDALAENDGADMAYMQRSIYNLITKMSGQTLFDFDKTVEGKTLPKAIDPEDDAAEHWLKKKAPESAAALCRTTLRPILVDAVREIAGERVMAGTARETLRYLSRLRMFSAIKREMDASNREHNRFLLSDTQQLLHRMINSSDTPFIYEKIGTRIRNIMIDEFQDTSSVQWDNFQILLRDSLAQGYQNLIVGDVKQSIYRWRSGDWRLLNNIEETFAPGTVQTIPLVTNRRSSTRIIDFNNHFFTLAAERMADALEENADKQDIMALKKAYEDVCQQYPEGKEVSGTVSVVVHPNVFVKPDEQSGACFDYAVARKRRVKSKESYAEAALDYVTDVITRLVHQGVSCDDIAVLVRNNREIPLIVRHATAVFQTSSDERLESVVFVSDEAYQLDSSPAVNILVAALRLLVSPDDAIVRARLSMSWQKFILSSGGTNTEILAKAALPVAYTERMGQLRAMPLYQLAEELREIFSIDRLENQSAYVCCFFDVLTEFMQRHIADIPTFLTAYDDTLHTRKTQDSGGHGIRILSIHKSKGLEFGHVIVPFCNWAFTSVQSPATLWCVPPGKPFDYLPVIPLEYRQKGMCNTLYEHYYHTERMQVHVDNLNLLYVAFTRAKDGLYIMSQADQNSEQRGSLIQSVMPDVAKAMGMETKGGNPAVNVDSDDGQERTPKAGKLESPVIYTVGGEGSGGDSADYDADNAESADHGGEAAKPEETNPFLMPSLPYHVHIKAGFHTPEFRESNVSRDFFDSLCDADNSASDFKTRKNMAAGQIIHSILSGIRTTADIMPAIRQHEMDGVLSPSVVSTQSIIAHLKRAMSIPMVSNWFSPGWTLYNECTILSYDKDTKTCREHRPDRVMMSPTETIVVDFKLSRFLPEYHDQVRRYMTLLSNMGYPNVRGYLWSIMRGDICEVKSFGNEK